ncbi:MAG: RAD55 family ATPase [Minisyncoccales bacterium]
MPAKKNTVTEKEQNTSPDMRVSTGNPNFDKIINGGFINNTTNLIVGGSGSGKTILATQFLMQGVSNGESCLFITFEEKKDQFYKNMKSFGWDLEKYEKKGLFNFLEYTPEKVKTMLEEGGGTIESIVLRKKISRIVIDSITSFALLFKDELEKRESSLELFTLLRKWDCTSILTYEEDPSSSLKSATKTMEFEADAIINLYFIRKNKYRKRYLEILKMRGTDHSKEVYPFAIGKGGININMSSVNDFNY